MWGPEGLINKTLKQAKRGLVGPYLSYLKDPFGISYVRAPKIKRDLRAPWRCLGLNYKLVKSVWVIRDPLKSPGM